MQTTALSRVTPSLAAIASQLLEFTLLYTEALTGVKDEDLLTRPSPGSNPLIWLAGHLVQQRTRLLAALGPPRQIPWEELFRSGYAVCNRRLYPTTGELEAVWRSASDELMRRIETTPEECFDNPAPCWLTSRDGTLRGGLSYAALHEAYDIGQMGYLRKWLGFDSLLDG
jgi:DinB family protein